MGVHAHIHCQRISVFGQPAVRMTIQMPASAGGLVPGAQGIVAQDYSLLAHTHLCQVAELDEPVLQFAHGSVVAVDYVLGLAKNARLKAEIAGEQEQAAAAYGQTGKAARVFKEFSYQTQESWSRARRVVAKAEHLEKGANPRFVVTSLSAATWEARALYEEIYCARGEMENRIKEQLMLFADRTSTAFLRSNQNRLYFSSLAYLLMEALRRLGLKATELAQAQAATIRLQVLKIGALIRITVRKVWVSLAGGYPSTELWARVLTALQAIPLRG